MLDQLDRFRPVLTHLGVFFLTLIFAIWFGRNATNITNTGIWQLEQSYQGIYVQAVADGYALDNNANLAAERLSFLCQQNEPSQLSNAIDQAAQRYPSPEKQANLNSLQQLVDEGAVTQNEGVAVCSTRPAGAGPFLPLLGLLVALAVAVGAGLYSIMGGGLLGGMSMASSPAVSAKADDDTSTSRGGGLPGIPFGGGKKDDVATSAPPASAAARGAVISSEAEKTDFVSKGVKPPIVQFMTTYLHGDDLYDDSFSIETSSGEFLGETGVGISETLDSSEGGKNVTAFEVWLFDKNDIRTVTKVIMSDYAFNDQALRDKLKAKGDAERAVQNEKVTLETATMRVQARIVDMAYMSGTTPPESQFERITIELAAWKREDV